MHQEVGKAGRKKKRGGRIEGKGGWKGRKGQEEREEGEREDRKKEAKKE